MKYDFVYRIAAAFPDARFTINGGLKTVEETKEALSHVPAAMLGRAIYDNPWTLNALDHVLFEDPISDRARIIPDGGAVITCKSTKH
ncbi:MAG: hypothetical protein EBV97_18775 [Rhodobacteraceae bacterium]|nr:hypothetical protein [Paracoccaceae bacterium]